MFSFTFADDHRRALTAAMKSPTAGIHVTLLAVSLAVLLVAITYQPLPEDFPQPWKYRFLSYWAHRVDQLGDFCERMNLFKHVTLIRNLHYMSIGLYQKRYPECRLKVYDRKIANVSVRIYQPEEITDDDKRTTLIYLHGGGFALGSIETYDQATYLLANLTRTTVVAVEYRLTPEHRFPSGLNDCLAVSRELFANGRSYQVNPNRIILSGDSAGGNLALVVSQSMIREGYKPYLLCLLYPSLQFLDFTLPSYRIYLEKNVLGVLNKDNLILMLSLLNGKETTVTNEILSNSHVTAADQTKLYPLMDPKKYLSLPHELSDNHRGNDVLVKSLQHVISPLLSPLLVPDEELLQLPHVLLFTTEFDILRDEGFIFASRLRSLNKSVYHHHFVNAFHGAHVFLYGPLRFDIAHEMIEYTAKMIRDYL